MVKFVTDSCIVTFDAIPLAEGDNNIPVLYIKFEFQGEAEGLFILNGGQVVVMLIDEAARLTKDV